MRATRVAIAVAALLLGCALAAEVRVEDENGVMDAEEAVRQGLVGHIGAPKGDEEDQEMEMGEAPYAQQRVPGMGHPAVKVSAMFPDHYGKEIPAGEDVEMLVWFANNGARPITIRGVVAFLMSAMDASRFVQNVCHTTHTHAHTLTTDKRPQTTRVEDSSRRASWTLWWSPRARRRCRTSSTRAST